MAPPIGGAMTTTMHWSFSIDVLRVFSCFAAAAAVAAVLWLRRRA
jgi:hypothetical protein